MALRYTPFVSTDDVNPLELNNRFTEISDSIDGVVDGSEAQTPSISDFTSATHDHEDAAGGGQLTVAALSSGAATDGQVATADGAGNVAWEDVADTFLDLPDTPSSYSGSGGGVLKVNSGETAVEAVYGNIEEYTLDEASNYTTTSTSFVDVDATNLSKDITVQSGSKGIEVSFFPTYWGSGAITLFFDFTIDGTPHAGDDGCFADTGAGSGYRMAGGFVRYVPLSSGTYTVRIQWKVNSGTGTLAAGAGTASGDVHPQFVVKEVL